jgi:tetratricopeptide (TPR) repeat protein
LAILAAIRRTRLKRYEEALVAYEKALSLKPDLENAWLGRGNVFRELKRFDAAFAATLSPDCCKAK